MASAPDLPKRGQLPGGVYKMCSRSRWVTPERSQGNPKFSGGPELNRQELGPPVVKRISTPGGSGDLQEICRLNSNIINSAAGEFVYGRENIYMESKGTCHASLTRL